MAKKKHKDRKNGDNNDLGYRDQLRALQIELVKVQRRVIKDGQKVLVIFEGRDAAGKDGTIKQIVEHMSPRDTRIVALGKPSDKERASWYFQRYVPHLPASGEIVFFNRSWYNRAGVEPVMGFCTKKEHEQFVKDVVPFEDMLVDAGVRVVKYYLDITRKEQKGRLAERREDPLKQWKRSPIDDAAQERWDEYTEARDTMLDRTSTETSPWIMAIANDKHAAHLNILRDLLTRLRDDKKFAPDPGVVFQFSADKQKLLAT
jgi:polyphosphate kinase 2